MTMGVRLKVGSSAGQFIVKPGPVHLVPGHQSTDLQYNRQSTVDLGGLWGVTQNGRNGGTEYRGTEFRIDPRDRPRSLTFIARAVTKDLVLGQGARPKSDTTKGNDVVKHRVPVLGPTRQQTELYLKKMARRKTNDFRYVHFLFLLLYIFLQQSSRRRRSIETHTLANLCFIS